MRAILGAIGEDPRREGLQKTPDRVEKAFRFLTKGYREDIDALVEFFLLRFARELARPGLRMSDPAR